MPEMVESVVSSWLKVLSAHSMEYWYFYMQTYTFFWTSAHILKFMNQPGKSVTIRELNQASGVRKAYYA